MTARCVRALRRAAALVAAVALGACAHTAHRDPGAVAGRIVSGFPARAEPDPARPFDDRVPAAPAKTPHPYTAWPFDVQHYDIEVAPDFERETLTGRVTITVDDAADGLAELPLDAVGMQVRRVVDATGAAVAFAYDGDVLRIALPGGTRTGTRRVFVVEYATRPRAGVHFLRPPQGAPEWGRQAWTQGEAEDTRHWLPCHDAPDDRATHTLSVEVPTGMLVQAAGVQQGVVERGARTTWTWSMATPHVSYLTTFVAGDLVRRELAGGPVPLTVVATPQQVDFAATSLRRTGEILDVLGTWTGRPYPYPAYAQCCVRDFVFGGMENISATTLTDRTVHPPGWEPLASSDGLVAHEAAHQWFGDLVTCRDWSHAWLNEGFATYAALVWEEHDEGRDAFLADVRGLLDGALGAAERSRRPVVSDVYAEPFDLFFDGHAYGGAAARLQALRVQLGDTRFVRAVQHYVATCAGTVVTTDDFARCVSESAGEDLGWFFDQWFRQPGRPRLRVRWEWDEAASALRVAVAQTHDEPGFPAVYRLPLDLECDLRDGSVERTRLDLDAREQTFSVRLPSAPRLVRIDPERGLLARLDLERPPADWAALAALDPSPAGRLDALDALTRIARDGKAADADRRAAREALLRAGRDDPRHEIRRAVVGHLRAVHDDAARDALVACLASDADVRVRDAAADALGDWTGDAVVCDALSAEALPATPFGATLLRAMARARAPGARARLVAALDAPSWQSRLRGAALEGFADLGDETAFPLLAAAAAAGADPWTRDEALSALGRMGRGRPDWTAAVVPHVFDERRAVRQAAANALGELEDAGAVPALMAAYEREPWAGTRRALREAVLRCRRAAVEAGAPVTLGAAEALRLRAEHAAARDAGDTARAAELERALERLGVAPTPAPKR